MGDATGLPTVVVGTAGHIDHGKTSLLRALTGIDADRLPEERARGMTIDVGYAHLVFPDGVEIDFVDVPGHDRLIGNMLVGAGEIDAAMLVVAADDGPRPQTMEHLQLLDALGISAGLAVVTKVDVVEPARVATVVAEVTTLLASTSLAGAPILTASSLTGEGIAAVRAALRGVRDGLATVLGGGGRPMRLAIDRVFAVKGRGTVVTGSLRGGPLEHGSVLRREPGGGEVRVREIQVRNQPRDRHEGGRTALNVAGAGAVALERGNVLTTDPAVVGTDRLLVDLRPAAPIGSVEGRAPKAGALLRLHVGTDQVDATMRRVAARPSLAVLTLEREIATFAGDRAVLREPASGAVLAGVRVIDPEPVRGISRRRLTPDRLERLASAVSRGDDPEATAARVDLHGAVAHGSTMIVASDVEEALRAAALDAVTTHHREAPVSAGLPLPRARAAVLRRLRQLVTIERRNAALAQAVAAAVIDALIAGGSVVRAGEALRDPAAGTAMSSELEAAMGRLEAALSVAAPPPLDEAASRAGCPPEGVRALAADGRIVRLGPDLAWATPTYHRLAALALELAREGPLTPAAYRDATGTSRKYVMAILEDLDRRGILRRTPDGHEPGPRAPKVVSP
ncbi:MAG: selenocysteine-specific translation elongation factor [Chloroflexi bacterium]|nr:selenocysteine-specific translation elongation factor [Chloroflexota bacterium]